MKDIRLENALSNKFAKEADELGIGSPYRISEYIRYRKSGLTKETALKKVKETRK